MFKEMFKQMVKEEGLVTKDYLAQYIEKKELASEKYVDGVAKEIIDAISEHNEKVEDQFSELKLTYVTRPEFEALKGKVAKYHPSAY